MTNVIKVRGASARPQDGALIETYAHCSKALFQISLNLRGWREDHSQILPRDLRVLQGLPLQFRHSPFSFPNSLAGVQINGSSIFQYHSLDFIDFLGKVDLNNPPMPWIIIFIFG